MKFKLLYILTIIFSTSSFIQTSTKEITIRPLITFAGITEGDISIKDHLSDSLHVTDTFQNHQAYIKSFTLTILCDERIVKYLKNKKSSSLTEEMKEAIFSLPDHGCALKFSDFSFGFSDSNENRFTVIIKKGFVKYKLK